ncbi:MAG TPA: hypothetical protein VI957_03160 [Candidatus Paceibacterota bacterium]
MGNIEKESRARRRKTNLKKILLETLFVGGVVSVALLAPNAIGVMKQYGFIPSPRQKTSLTIARDRLLRKGFIERKEGMLRITARGERELRMLDSGSYRLKKPRHWDGRWRILIFDIPERRKSLRDKLRLTLLSVGFVRLQDSVWLYPYDCEDFVVLLKSDFKIGKDMLYLIVDALEGDQRYRKLFGFS